jgi:cell division protein FtsB
MRVLQALLERRGYLADCVATAERELAIAKAQYDELTAAIEMIEADADPLDAPVNPPVLKSGLPRLMDPPANGAAAPIRRNIRELVSDHLRALPGVFHDTAHLVQALSAQKSSVTKALEKLKAEELVEGDEATGWRWVVWAGSEKNGPESVFVPASIDGFLADRPEGASAEEIQKFGLAEAITAGVEAGTVWQDSRGYYHQTPGEAPST